MYEKDYTESPEFRQYRNPLDYNLFFLHIHAYYKKKTPRMILYIILATPLDIEAKC